MFDQYLRVKSTKNGMGVFTTTEIPAGVPITEITGNIFANEKLAKETDLQIGPNIYMGLSGNATDSINHNCNPNCLIHVVGHRAILYSIYVIKPDNELTFDYSSSSTDTLDQWKMDCNCGDNKCRKVISGFHYLDQQLQEEYKKKGIAALFLTHPIFQKR